MNLLAIDTATESCSVALLINGKFLQTSRLIPNGHAKWLMPMIEELLMQASINFSDINKIAVDIGPGSFTSLRIGVAVAQGLAYSLQLQVYPVCSLHALAAAANATWVIASIDARMQQIYWGQYHRNLNGNMCLQGELALSAPDDPYLIELIQSGMQQHQGARPCLVGTGWRAYQSMLSTHLDQSHLSTNIDYPKAVTVATIAAHHMIGAGIAALDLAPLYIRNQVAHKK